MTPENDREDAAILRDLQADFPHLDITMSSWPPTAPGQPEAATAVTPGWC